MKKAIALFAALSCMLFAAAGCEAPVGVSSADSESAVSADDASSLPSTAEVSSVPSVSSAAPVTSAPPSAAVSSVSSTSSVYISPELLVGDGVLTRPPLLKLFCGDAEVKVQQSSSHWYFDVPDGQEYSIIACGPHPLGRKGQLQLTETSAEKAVVRCEVMPDSMTVGCWRDDGQGDGAAKDENAAVSADEITLKQGTYTYEIEAHWTSQTGYRGWCRYAFYINRK